MSTMLASQSGTVGSLSTLRAFRREREDDVTVSAAHISLSGWRVAVSEADPEGRAEDPEQLQQVVWLNQIYDAPNHKLVRLAGPLRVDVFLDPDDGGVIAYSPYLRCSGTGSDLQGALEDLAQSALLCKQEIGEAADGDLASDALVMKRRLLSMLR